MDKKEEVVKVGTVKLNVDLECHTNSIPMVGWHEQWATVTDGDGKQWELKIAGGCKVITLQEKDAKELKFYAIHISEILPAMVEAIKKIRK